MPPSLSSHPSLPLSSCLSFSPFLADRSDIRNLYYQVFPGCWWKSWFATPDWIYLSFIPFQPPTSCPSRQEPNSLSIPRCQGIKISICRRRGREEETWRGTASVGPHVTALDSQVLAERGVNVHFGSLPSRPGPHPLWKALSTSIIQPFISSKQTMSLPPSSWIPPPLHTHMHVGQRRCPDERSHRESIKGR